MKLSSFLYGITRTVGKAASKANDIETLLTGNPKKIVKRMGRKTVYKHMGKSAKKINKKFF